MDQLTDFEVELDRIDKAIADIPDPLACPMGGERATKFVYLVYQRASLTGNFRELEQCVRSVMLRGTYEPRMNAVHADARDRIAHNIVNGHFSADDLLRHYCTLLYATSRNYSTVAEKLQIDRRTVRAKVDQELLREL